MYISISISIMYPIGSVSLEIMVMGVVLEEENFNDEFYELVLRFLELVLQSD